jgi:hypothetical protein
MVVPGNHDLWTRHPHGSSLDRYEQELPQAASRAGFHYLDHQPFLQLDVGLALVGSINWYDYSFADPELETEFPGAQMMYRAKHFPNGRHNDGRFVQLGMTDPDFAGQ